MQEKNTQYVDYLLSRLKSALKLTSDAELASFLGLSPQAISSWRSRNAINFDIIFAKCVDIDLNWLIRGDATTQNADKNGEAPLKENMRPHSEGGGTPLDEAGGPQRGPHSDKKGAPLVAIKTENPREGIPLIPAHAIAGIFSGEINVLELECERFVVPVFKDAEFLIQVKGNSMYPKYNSGDIVACKKLPLDTFFQWNKVYVLDTDQGPLIKRVKKASLEDRLLIVSDNATYEAFELEKHHIYNISIVIGVIRLE